MKHYYCKNINILDKGFVVSCVINCFANKWNRYDVATYLGSYLPELSKK